MSIDYAKATREAARLIILQELAKQHNESLATNMMEPALEQQAIYQEAPWINMQIEYLHEMGAVTVLDTSAIKIATLTKVGHRHLLGHKFIEGVKRHSFGA